jgi:hypothetical protein
MSLTKAQWEEMWKSVKDIERAYYDNAIPSHSGYRRSVKKAIDDIKRKIESVIGQME